MDIGPCSQTIIAMKQIPWAAGLAHVRLHSNMKGHYSGYEYL